jgi:hypothetical protein
VAAAGAGATGAAGRAAVSEAAGGAGSAGWEGTDCCTTALDEVAEVGAGCCVGSAEGLTLFEGTMLTGAAATGVTGKGESAITPGEVAGESTAGANT